MLPQKTPIVTLENVVKDYPLGKLTVTALKGVSFSIDKGEFVCLAGPSGSGKTTALNLIGCVDVATSGKVTVDDDVTNNMSDRQLTQIRLHKIGFIFQTFNLVPVLNVFQNVEMPLLLQGTLNKAQRRERVANLLAQVGLETYLTHRPNELSGGQRQRVAVARALVTHPLIVLADEPTANLDSVNSQNIIDLMREMNRVHQTTFIFSSHDPMIQEMAGRIIAMRDGKITDARHEAALHAHQ